MPTTTSADPVYVYAAIEGPAPTLPAAGMPEGHPPRAVALAEHVALIVSTVPSRTYNAASLEASLTDLDWVAAAGGAHHAVVDAVAEGGVAVLPFGLFTVFSNEEKAVTTMRSSLPAIKRAFDRIRGKQEWALQIGKPDPARAERQEPAAAATSGTSFLAGKAAARRDAADRAERVRVDAAMAYEALERLADAARAKAVDPRGELVLDAAFLTVAARVDDLRQTLTRVTNRLLRDGCRVSLTGPWPPYSFSSLDTEADA